VAARPFFRSAARVVLLGAAALGCQQKAPMSLPSSSGGTSGGSDAATQQSLGISVTGCATFDVKNKLCYGTAPLTVSFAPVGSSAFTNFLWSYGDGSPPSQERAPMHTFTLPSSGADHSYDVYVTGQVGETGGTVQSPPTEVIVTSVPAGAACDVDKQCGQGLRCLCQVGSQCSAAFSRGICSTTCATGFCGIGSVCAEIALGPTTADAGPAGPFCLTDCSGSATCGPGYVCQKMPGGPDGSTWVSGCLPLGAERDFGLSCRDPSGALQDGACATGHCADIGTLGMCTATCDSAHPCPSGACARLPGGAQLCLPACSTATPCTSDPGLACTTPADAAVDGGLTIAGGTAGVAYCAPI
jgi:PKD repeat protein